MLFRALAGAWEVDLKLINPPAACINVITEYCRTSNADLSTTRDQMGNLTFSIHKPAYAVGFSSPMKSNIDLLIDEALRPGNRFSCQQGVDRQRSYGLSPLYALTRQLFNEQPEVIDISNPDELMFIVPTAFQPQPWVDPVEEKPKAAPQPDPMLENKRRIRAD